MNPYTQFPNCELPITNLLQWFGQIQLQNQTEKKIKPEKLVYIIPPALLKTHHGVSDPNSVLHIYKELRFKISKMKIDNEKNSSLPPIRTLNPQVLEKLQTNIQFSV